MNEWHEIQEADMLFAIFLARRAFAPIPGAWFTTLPSGAWGTTTCAACDGLWRGWIEAGEPSGEDVADMLVRDSTRKRHSDRI